MSHLWEWGQRLVRIRTKLYDHLNEQHLKAGTFKDLLESSIYSLYTTNVCSNNTKE